MGAAAKAQRSRLVLPHSMQEEEEGALYVVFER